MLYKDNTTDKGGKIYAALGKTPWLTIQELRTETGIDYPELFHMLRLTHMFFCEWVGCWVMDYSIKWMGV